MTAHIRLSIDNPTPEGITEMAHSKEYRKHTLRKTSVTTTVRVRQGALGTREEVRHLWAVDGGPYAKAAASRPFLVSLTAARAYVRDAYADARRHTAPPPPCGHMWQPSRDADDPRDCCALCFVARCDTEGA